MRDRLRDPFIPAPDRRNPIYREPLTLGGVFQASATIIIIGCAIFVVMLVATPKAIPFNGTTTVSTSAAVVEPTPTPTPAPAFVHWSERELSGPPVISAPSTGDGGLR